MIEACLLFPRNLHSHPRRTELSSWDHPQAPCSPAVLRSAAIGRSSNIATKLMGVQALKFRVDLKILELLRHNRIL